MVKKSGQGPGRPKGADKDDSRVLDQMADMIFLRPDLKPTTAMKRLGVRDPSDIRRHQVKWKARSLDLLENAAERQKRTVRHRSERVSDTRPVFANPLATSDTSRALASLETVFGIDPIRQAFKLASIGKIEEFAKITNKNRMFLDQICGDEFQKNLKSTFKNLGFLKKFQ